MPLRHKMCNFHENIVALMLRKMRRTFIARQKGCALSPFQNKRAHNLELYTHTHTERETAKERHLESFRVALLL